MQLLLIVVMMLCSGAVVYGAHERISLFHETTGLQQDISAMGVLRKRLMNAVVKRDVGEVESVMDETDENTLKLLLFDHEKSLRGCSVMAKARENASSIPFCMRKRLARLGYMAGLVVGCYMLYVPLMVQIYNVAEFNSQLKARNFAWNFYGCGRNLSDQCRNQDEQRRSMFCPELHTGVHIGSHIIYGAFAAFAMITQLRAIIYGFDGKILHSQANRILHMLEKKKAELEKYPAELFCIEG
jgi:hypothetical protein